MPRKKPLASKIAPSSMEERINVLKRNHDRFLVRLMSSISRTCIMYGSKAISHFGISMSQAIVLGELFSKNGCRQDDLRVFVTLDKGNITRALQRLEEYGLVQRRQDPVDRRVVRVYVTRKALSIELEMYALATLLDDKLTAGFTQEERETLVTLLLRIDANAKAMAKKNEVQSDCKEN